MKSADEASGLTTSFNMGPANSPVNGQAFENTSTNVAASQMRNALNKLADTVTDPNEKKVSRQSVFLLYRNSDSW
jgi:UTP--glucose-1-phosphate uridylyltransferase